MKKFLSMAMALVMSLSLCAIVTAPKAEAGFDDIGTLSQYSKQAIEVIQAIQVMDGTTESEFAPDAGLTRRAAAKIICNMILGPTTAKALPTSASPFPDVPSDNQFSGYISYCQQQGIISGYGDGTFRPGDPLSGYAYLKMLLGALGYDSLHEGFVGDNWKVNVAKIALGIDLNRGVVQDFDGTTQITREDAAIYAFNTLQADMVEYDAKNTVEVNGVTVSMGGGNAVPQTWGTSATQANHISAAQDNGRPIVQFAERYFDKLEREPNGSVTATNPTLNNGRDIYTQDDFGRPSIKWKWKGTDIGTYSRDPDARFVGGVKVNAIYEALGMSSGDSTACLYINSKLPNKTNLKVERGNDKDLDHANNLDMWREGDAGLPSAASIGMSRGGDGNHRVDRIGDGALIECFLNEANNHVDVCVISLYAGKVDAVKAATSKKDAYVTIDPGNGDPNHQPDTIFNNGKNEYETEDFEEEDYVVYTYSDSDEGIKNMYHMEADSGVLSSRVSEKNLRLDGTTFYYAKEYMFNDMQERDLSNKSSYVVYTFDWSSVLDDVEDSPHVFWVEEDEFAVDQYVLIERINIEASNGAALTSTITGGQADNGKVVVRTSSGARRTYTLDDAKNYRTTNGAALASGFQAGRIVRLSSNDDGYRLHALADTYFFSAPRFTIDGKTIKTNGGTVKTNAGETLIVDSETHFTVEDTKNDTYKAYVGTKNVPTVTGTQATAYIYHRGAVAKQVFITGSGNVSSSTKDVVFLLAPSTSNLVESDDGDYYDVLAIDKDELVTLRVKAGTAFEANGSYFEPGSKIANTKNEGNCVVLNKVTYDSNDLVTAGSFDNAKISASRAQGIRRANDTEVTLDTGAAQSYKLDVADNVRVFYAENDSNIEQIDYADIINDTKDAIYYVTDDDVVTYIFIVNYEDDGWPARATAPAYTLTVGAKVAAGYTMSVVNGSSAKAGTSVTFQVFDSSNNPVGDDKVTVALEYTDTNNVVITNAATATGDQWTVTVPGAGEVDTTQPVEFVVTVKA